MHSIQQVQCVSVFVCTHVWMEVVTGAGQQASYLIGGSSIVNHINHSSTLFDSSIDPDSQHPAGYGRNQLLQHITPGIINSPNCLTLGDILKRHNIHLNPATVHDSHTGHVRRLVRLGQIYSNRSGAFRRFSRVHLQVVDQAVDEVLCARDQSAVPVLRWADFESDRWNAVVYPGRFDTAGLTGVDLDDIGLGELGKVLDARKGKVGVGP